MEFNNLDSKPAVIFEYDKNGNQIEKYYGTFSICNNPMCTCEVIDFRFSNKEADIISRTFYQYNFRIDVFKKKLQKDYLDNRDKKKFAKAFHEQLNELDWNKLQDAYIKFKEKITENIANGMVVDFSDYNIEDKGEMVEYHMILPYAPKTCVNREDKFYWVEFQFCVQRHCNCKDVLLNFIPMPATPGKIVDDYPTVKLNYKTKSWSVVDCGVYKIEIIGKLMESFLNKGYSQLCDKAHKKLKMLYENYYNDKCKNKAPATKKQEAKVGRNEPCPCGSGKKYKKCCLEK